MGENERDLAQARLSNLHHYAVTGVKAQAFVLDLFYIDSIKRNYINNINILRRVMTKRALPVRLGALYPSVGIGRELEGYGYEQYLI
jgi:hypothetical protein